jgi:hypothetical protein
MLRPYNAALDCAMLHRNIGVAGSPAFTNALPWPVGVASGARLH